MNEHIVINKDRSVVVPISEKKIGIQYDHNVNKITFDCPRYADDNEAIDMSRMHVFLNYMLPDKTTGCTILENVVVDDTDPAIIHFDWVVTRNHTLVKGVMSTLICIKQTDTEGTELYHWNTNLFQQFIVGDGMECSEIIVDENPDVITQLLVRMDTVDARTSTEAMQGYVDTSVNTYLNQNPITPTDEQATTGINTYMNNHAQTEINAYMTENAQGCVNNYLTEHPVSPTEEQMKQGVAANSEMFQSSVDEYLGRNPLQLDNGLTETTKAAPANKVGEIQSDVTELKGDLSELQISVINSISNNFTDLGLWQFVNYSATSDNGVVTLTATKVSYPASVGSVRLISAIPNYKNGHKYYCSLEVKSEKCAALGRIYIGNSFTEEIRVEKGMWGVVDGIVTPSENEELGFYVTNVYGSNVGDVLQVRNPICIDLTDNGISDIDYIRYITKNQYFNSINKAQLSEETFLLNKDSVLIASKDSKYAEFADYVCGGINDDILINSVIAKDNVKHIKFASDSLFYISSEIVLKSNFVIESNGARFTTTDNIETIGSDSAVSIGENFINVGYDKAKDFYPNMFVEIKDGSNTESFYISRIDYTNGKIYRNDTFTKSYKSDTVQLRNVSSCFGGRNITNVKIKGIIIDWNFPNNIRANNTFWAQNGIHFDNCTYCDIIDCTIDNGGRHGILYCDSKYSRIVNCNMYNWGEHCIDIYNRDYNNPQKNHIIIENCILRNATMCGIQLHCGSGVTISDCICNGNMEHGISMLQNSYGNLVTNCSCNSNEMYGLYCNDGIHDVNISNCQFVSNIRDGIQLDTGVNNITINGCEFRDNGWKSLLIYGASKCNIYGNTFKKNTQTVCVGIENGSTKNLITNNIFDKDSGNGKTAVNELSTDCDYNVVSNNLLVGMETIASFNPNNYSIEKDNYMF